jgi:hypothetical protein
MNLVTINDNFANADPLFLADEQAAVNILNATFTNNVTVTITVGLGAIMSWNDQFRAFVPRVLDNQNGAAANYNFQKVDFLTYSDLRTNLRTKGQPNFFTTANLPVGNSINNISNFYISSSVAKAWGMAVGQPTRPTASSASASVSPPAPRG